MQYIRHATVEKVTDGDTVAVLVDMGFSLYARYACRVLLDEHASIDTPERGHADYAAAVAYARSLLAPGDTVIVESIRFVDKYGGRFDGRVFLPDGRSFGEVMVTAGHARVWGEGQPKPFPRAGTASS